MKLFGSFKLTDRIRIGASSGGRRKSSKSSKSGATGCLSIFFVLCVICIPISLIRSCVKGDDDETTTETTLISQSGITALEFLSTDDVELEVGQSKLSWFKVKASDGFNVDDIVLVSSDEDVATFTFDKISAKSFVYYNIDAVAPGTATVHVETADGKVKSDTITVIVTEKTTEEETTEEETTTSEPDTTKKPKETTKKAEEITTKQTSGKTVYRTPSGERYHFDPECGGKNSYSVSLDDAKSSGLTPCQKCAN